MNGDLSLSQSLGGLRIANPDQDTTSPSLPPLNAGLSQHETSERIPLKDSVEQAQSQSQTQMLPTLQDEESSALGSLGFNPESFMPSADPPVAPTLYSEPISQANDARISYRQSVPMAAAAASQALYNNSQTNPGRAYGAPNSAPRPMSNLYNHPNISGSSTNSAAGTYRYRDEPIGPTSAPASGMSRSSSRAAAVAMQAGVPTRESSRSDRGYRAVQSVVPGNGPLPPRRASRRIPESSMGSQMPIMEPTSLNGAPYLDSNASTPAASSDDWRDRGAAAVGVRQEVDPSGKPVSRVIKKGVSDFKFGRLLGEGSYSTVHAATDKQTGREYAIKVLDKRHIIKEKKVKYVNIERDTLNRLTEHPGVIRLFFTFQDERQLYFVLGMANGGELLGFLKNTGSFDIECTRFYGAQILDTIDYMHTRGVIHRDLKPENVLLDEHMHVKITDFGTAKLLNLKSPNGTGQTAGDPLDGAESDRAVSFVGTAEYVSPELLTDKNACKASDLWAYGCIIYQLLAGRPPFKAANEYLTFQKIVALEYTFPEGFPPAARDLVERLLVLDPARRLPIEHIKNHQFFDGMIWGKGLWKQRAPALKPYMPAAAEPMRLNGGPTGFAPKPVIQNTSVASQIMAHSSGRPTPRLITELPPPSQLDIEWSPVLTRNNERILKLGNMVVTSHAGPYSPNSKTEQAETPKKFSSFFKSNTTKKRQRLVMVTSSARLVLVPAGGEEKKTKLEIPLLAPGTTFKTFVDPKGLTYFCVETRDKHLIFEDPKATTSDPDGSKYCCEEWVDMMESAREFASSQHPADDLGSALSSPANTIGEDAALDGVNIPRSRHLSKDHGDTDSIKRKRFSKRNSKNGLAAVF